MDRRTATSVLLAPLAGIGAVLLSAVPVAAHTGSSVGGLGDGALHPITGTDHLLAMVAVGVVAAVAFTGRQRWLAPAAFLAAMVVGGLIGLAGVALPGAELLIVGSVISLGLAVAGAVEVGDRAGVALLGLLAVAGIAHGYAHGAEAPVAASPILYVLGFLAATASLHLAGVGVGVAIRDRTPVRLGLGAATAAAGTLLLLG
jgi:urease accessory protein